jgi:hypothetical protein
MCSAQADVRFTPNSGHHRIGKLMSHGNAKIFCLKNSDEVALSDEIAVVSAVGIEPTTSPE